MRLKDKVAIVTGASTGIGRAVVLAFAREGADVVITKRSTPVDDLVQEIESLGRQCLVVKASTSSTEDMNRLAEETLNKYGRIDILFSNAGITHGPHGACEVAEMPDEEWDYVMDVNLKGTFRACRAVLPSMIKQKYGQIICVSSIIGARQGWQTRVHYSATKAGIEGIVRSLAIEVAKYGIFVSGIAPGLVETPQTLDPTSMTKKGLDIAAKNIVPAGFIAKPEDIAHLAVYLASDESNYLIANPILIDGGMIARSVNLYND